VGTDEWFWPEKLAHVLARRWERPAGPDDSRRALEAQIEAEISRFKKMCRADIDRAVDQLLRESGVRLPAERAVMSWDEVAEMARNDISFGSHSVTHAILTRERPEDVEQEIRASLGELQARPVNCVPVFCYPNGNYSAEIAERVRLAGYQGAVSTQPGWETRIPSDLFGLRRVGIHHDVTQTVPLFALRLAGLDDAMRRR
jgi:peptidoglycan/xylan/chitin deacetylase (PgdA/CDA1 family)